MAITLGTAFNRTSSEPIDQSQVLSKSEMLAMNDDLMPEKYFAVCSDDGRLYTYDKSATPNGFTGKFTIASGGGIAVELTQAEYDALSPEEKMNGTVYYIKDANSGGGGGQGGGGTVNLYFGAEAKYIAVRDDVKSSTGANEAELTVNNQYTGCTEIMVKDGEGNSSTRFLQEKIEAGRNIVKRDDGKTVDVKEDLPNMLASTDGTSIYLRAYPESLSTSERKDRELVVDNNIVGGCAIRTREGDETVRKILQEKIEAGWNLVLGADGKSLAVHDSVSYNIPDSNGYAVFVRSRPMRENGTRGFVDLAVDQTPVGATAITTREDENTVTKFLQEKVVAGNGLILAADGKTLHTNFFGQNGILVSNTDRTIKITDELYEMIQSNNGNIDITKTGEYVCGYMTIGKTPTGLPTLIPIYERMVNLNVGDLYNSGKWVGGNKEYFDVWAREVYVEATDAKTILSCDFVGSGTVAVPSTFYNVESNINNSYRLSVSLDAQFHNNTTILIRLASTNGSKMKVGQIKFLYSYARLRYLKIGFDE